METHVCVLQTVIDLLGEGYDVHVVKDANEPQQRQQTDRHRGHGAGRGRAYLHGELSCSSDLKIAGTTASRSFEAGQVRRQGGFC